MTPRIFALLASLVLLAACSSGTTSTPAPPASSPASMTAAPAAATGPTISISGMKFTSPTTVSPGATVTVTNSDGAEHTVTADSGAAFNVEVEGKGTATFTAPTQPGTYAYHCTYHPMMHGQLIVA